MIALTIEETRPFMAALLTKDLFDRFLLREATVVTFCTYTIDGSWQKAYFGDDEPADSDSPRRPAASLTPWSYLRAHVFDLIKGQHTPLSMKLVFQYPADLTEALLEKENLSSALPSVYGLYLNLRFENGKILLTTGSAQQSFPPSHDVDHAWDRAVKDLLTDAGLSFSDIS